ncbi:MAG: hypothetical protein KDK70_24635 [Myxococcales bacterium]|nr:hypothetical protein [Myxococcales bacterium]
MSAVAGGLRRLLAAPGLWVGAWLGLAALAFVSGRLVGVVVSAAVVPFDALRADHLIFGLLDVLEDHPAAAAAMAVTLAASTLISALGWMLLSPLGIARLADRTRDWAEVGGRALRTLPAVVVQTLWHGVLRALLVLAVLLTVQPLPGVVAWGLLGLAWVVAGVALDATRVAVVEHDAAPFHVRTAVRGFLYAVRRPRLLLPCSLMSLGQLAITAAGLWLAVLQGQGQGVDVARRDTDLWIGPELAVAVAWAPTPRLALRLSAEGTVAVRRPAFTLRDHPVLFRAPRAGARLMAGVELRFPAYRRTEPRRSGD